MYRVLASGLSLLLAFLLAIAAIEVSAADAPKASTDNTGNIEVVAEGAGTTPDEALKDAFRNAVRQAVGAVVDAETLVKNDEIIDDQILTYSNGFVKKYDEVPGSKKQQAGLHRIKIKAEVERRNLIAKLKAAKVMMKGLDGKSLFAEAITSEDAEQNATKLLAKVLSDLPKVLTATVEGTPHYDRSASELIVDLVLEVDLKAYREFSIRLHDTLKKISLATETLQLVGIQMKGETDKWMVHHQSARDLLGPKISDDKGKTWCLWVCDSSANNHSRLRWKGYVLDADISTTILPYVTPSRNPRNIHPKLFVGTSLLDTDEGVMAKDEFPLLANDRYPWLVQIVPRHRERPEMIKKGDDVERAEWVYSYVKSSNQRFKDFSVNAYVAPYAISVGRDFFYQTKQTYQRRIKLPLDKLKLIEDVKCSVIYTPDAAATK